MQTTILNLFGKKTTVKQFFYPIMHTMNLKNNYDAIVAEMVIRYLNEQLGIAMSNITPDFVEEIANYAKLRSLSVS